MISPHSVGDMFGFRWFGTSVVKSGGAAQMTESFQPRRLAAIEQKVLDFDARWRRIS